MSRVLVIPSWYPPDGGQFFQDQAEALVDAGFQVDILVNRMVGLSTIRRSHAHSYRLFGVSEVGGCRLIRSMYLKLPGLTALNFRRWTLSTYRLYRRYEKRFGKPGLILAHSSLWAGYVGARIKEAHSIPLVVVEHRSRFTLDEAAAGDLLPPSFTHYIRESYAGADALVAVSDGLHKGMRRYINPDRDIKIQTIPNLVDTDAFSMPPVRPDALRILSVGRFEHVKGYDLLLDAFARIAPEYTGAELRLVGDGPLRTELEKQAGDLGIGDRVRFVGKLRPEEIVDEMQQASLFALASRYEAFGVVFIEAMACGLPLVATRSGGPETFIPGLAGKVVEAEDPPGLAAAMKEILDNPETYDREAIRQYAVDHFSREAFSLHYLKLIKGLLDD